MLGNHQAYNYKIQLVPHHLKHPPKFSHMVCNQKWDVGPNKELFKEEIIPKRPDRNLSTKQHTLNWPSCDMVFQDKIL